MAEQVCNNTSCGMVVKDAKGRYLLIERMNYPKGFACPAGHLEQGESFEQAAKRELKEEVGLEAAFLTELLHKKMQNPCRRPGGSWHEWKVYGVEAKGNVAIEPSEAKKYVWLTQDEIRQMAERTALYEKGSVSEDEWNARPGLEPAWRDLLRDLGII